MTPEARKADDTQEAAEALQEEEARKAAEALAGIAAETRDALDAITQQSLLAMQEAATRAMDAIAEWRDWIRTTAYPQLMDTLQAQADAMPTLAAIPPEELQTLTPGILQALADYCKARGIDDAGLSISDLAQLVDPDTGRQVIDLAIERARKAPEAQQALIIQTKPVRSADWPLDPFSRIFDAGPLPADQLTIFDGLHVTDKDGPADKEVDLFLAIDPTGLNLLEEFNLNPAQRRYYVAMDALKRAGNDYVSISQIFHLAGGKGPLNKKERAEMDEMLNICGAQITANNRDEVDAGHNRSYVEYKGALFPLERINERAVINGQLIDSYVHLFRDAPLLELARERKQVTSFPPEVLQLPEGMHHTKHTDKIVEYLIYRISHMKHGTDRQRKIVWKSLFEYTHITSKRTQYNKMADTGKILKEWKRIGYIKNFTDDGLALTIELDDSGKALPKARKRK